MKLLVTGSTGQIGSYLVDPARQRGHTTVGLDKQPDGGQPTNLAADIRDGEICEQAIEGIDAVVHGAAQIRVQHSIEHPADDASHNDQTTINLLEAAR